MNPNKNHPTGLLLVQASNTGRNYFFPKKSNGGYERRLTYETMSDPLKRMEYAVRGQVVILADKISQELQSSASSSNESESDKYPFDHIVYTNIGNPQSVGQKPLTWPRQVMALVDLPAEVGVDHSDVQRLFPADVVERAREIKGQIVGGSGAYSHSQGVLSFRKDICEFLRERDGVGADPDNIFMTNGASAAIDMMFTSMISDENSGIMIPIPQYPIYTALIELKQGVGVGYNLNEEEGWSLSIENLEKTLEDAKAKGIEVKSLVIINPGNPTGSVLTKKMVQDICLFCSKHRLVLMADEVYQENVYSDNAEFYSCKRAAHELGLLKVCVGHVKFIFCMRFCRCFF